MHAAMLLLNDSVFNMRPPRTFPSIFQPERHLMFKKTMKFDDLEGNPAEQTFYFNYTRKEVSELMEFGYVSQFRPDNLATRLPLEQQLEILRTPVEESGFSQVENTQRAYDIFQDLLLDAYGEKGADNVTFKKSRSLREYWESHVAFVDMLFEFIENPALGAEFIEKCLPPKFVAEAKAELQKAGKLSDGTLAEMVEEAERRQQDPATRIEPGIEAAREALGPNPVIEDLAQAVASDEVKAKKPEDLTAAEIWGMDDIAFQKLDVRKLQGREEMLAAFERKAKKI